MVRVFRLFALLTAGLLPCACVAQTQAETDPTLHVFVNRIQIPVLVLSQYGRPLRSLPESSFRITLDGVGTFPPTHVRLEGDDPLAVAVIVDASDAHERMWQDLPKAVEKLLPTLHPQDRLTLYGLDGCKAFRFLPEDAPLNASVVHAGVEQAMTMKARTAEKEQASTCSRALTMAEMVSYVTLKLSTFPGRRMVVTVGAGSGYSSQMDQLKQMLNSQSTMLLPVVHDSALAAMPMPYLPRRGGPIAVVNGGVNGMYGTLAEVAEYSGGRVQYIASHEFTDSLANAVEMARGRYILEFPRPDKLTAGHYRISVTDGHPRDFIRASGISVPVANAEEIAAARAAAAAGQEQAVPSPMAAPPVAPPTPTQTPAASAEAMRGPVTVTPPQVASPAAVAAPPDPTDITGDLKPSR